MDELAEVQGYKHVFAALQSIEKVSAVKKTEQFDRFFERKRGQPLDVLHQAPATRLGRFARSG
jgi:hypothetical protein